MKHLFIGGYYDGHRMQVAPGIEQIVFEVARTSSLRPKDDDRNRLVFNAETRFIYTRRQIIDDGKRVFVFVLDAMRHEDAMQGYLKLTKGKNHG